MRKCRHWAALFLHCSEKFTSVALRAGKSSRRKLRLASLDQAAPLADMLRDEIQHRADARDPAERWMGQQKQRSLHFWHRLAETAKRGRRIAEITGQRRHAEAGRRRRSQRKQRVRAKHDALARNIG